MILRDILCFVLFGIISSIQAQDLPHPKYNLRYHYTHFDHPQKTKVDEKISKELIKKYQPIGLDTFDFYIKIENQLGYDTIRAYEISFPVSPFYIQRFEVSNKEYHEFLNDSLNPARIQAKLTQRWLTPDVNVWIDKSNYSEAYQQYYFQHKAYDNYPVVGISQFQATAYCDWLEVKLNESLKSLIPKGYKLIVDLPTSAEFYAAVDECILKPTIKFNQKKTNRFILPYQYVFENMPPYAVNFRHVLTDRMAQIEINTNVNPTDVIQDIPKGYLQVHHLLGNVSEWTSTRAWGHLYNNKDFVYTTQGKIVPNLDETHKPEVLNTYLRDDASLKTHFVVKGGSWMQDLFYLDPSSIEINRGDKKNAYTGFRTVIRLKAL